jgi:hypothetical protein
MSLMKRFLPLVLGAALATMTSACISSADAGVQQGRAVGSPLIDAALVTPQFGWVLTADQVLLTKDGGSTFTAAPAPVPSGLARTAYFRDATQGWVAATDGATITVARTTDGGATWKTSTVESSEPIGSLSVGFGDATDGALVAKVQTSPAFSRAHLFGTADSGATWQEKSAPVAGPVTVDADGRLWLAGGVLGNELYTSSDHGTKWTQPSLTLAQPGTIDGVTAPLDGVVSATVSNGTTTHVARLTSPDGGATWRESPTAKPAKPAPAGAFHATYASGTAGWAVTSTGQCAHGKQDCSVTYSVLGTTDGGAAWKHLITYVEKLT